MASFLATSTIQRPPLCRYPTRTRRDGGASSRSGGRPRLAKGHAIPGRMVVPNQDGQVQRTCERVLVQEGNRWWRDSVERVNQRWHLAANSQNPKGKDHCTGSGHTFKKTPIALCCLFESAVFFVEVPQAADIRGPLRSPSCRRRHVAAVNPPELPRQFPRASRDSRDRIGHRRSRSRAPGGRMRSSTGWWLVLV